MERKITQEEYEIAEDVMTKWEDTENESMRSGFRETMIDLIAKALNEYKDK